MPSGSAGQAASLLAFFTVGGLLIAALLLPGPGGSYSPYLSADPLLKRGLLERTGAAISQAIQNSAPVTLHHDFRAGLSGWETLALRSADKLNEARNWLSSAAPETVAPGSLRIWNRSVALQNYQMEFLGQLEKRSLSWAFRATNEDNYYAAKLVITKPGPLPNAGLIRYVMLNGRESDRVQLPLPLTLERGGNYRIRVSVQDDRFITYLNGQVISSWSDRRLRRGGVGFFSDDEDPQQIDWVNLSERDSFLGRMLAHFSLIVLPGRDLP